MVQGVDPSTVFTAVIAVVGVVVGGVISLGGTAYLDHRRASHERKALAAALIADIEGTLRIEKNIGYRAEYQRCLDEIRRGNPEPMPNYGYEWDNTRSVYYTNLARIGILPASVVGKLVEGSYVFQAVVADRQCMDRGQWDTQVPGRRAKLLERHLEVYDQAVALYQTTVTDLWTVR